MPGLWVVRLAYAGTFSADLGFRTHVAPNAANDCLKAFGELSAPTCRLGGLVTVEIDRDLFHVQWLAAMGTAQCIGRFRFEARVRKDSSDWIAADRVLRLGQDDADAHAFVVSCWPELASRNSHA